MRLSLRMMAPLLAPFLGGGLLLLAGLAPVQAAGVGRHAGVSGEALVHIDLSASVGVVRPEVTLGDIAVMSTPDLQVLKRLVAMPLGPAPRAGEKAQLGRTELMHWIHLRTGLNPRQVTWEGAQAAEVHRASAQIPGAQFVATATENLQAWLAAHSSHADISVTAVPRDVAVPLGQSVLKPRPMAQDAPLARRMVVWVDVWVDDRFVRTVPVGFEVAAYGPAYVAAGDMPVGTRLNEQVLSVREVELTGRAAPVLAPAGTPMGTPMGSAAGNTRAPVPAEPRQLRRPVPAGAALTRLDVESPPAVARGDWVALRVRSGAIEMEERAEALQNGRIGQTVNVKPAKATSAILARVVGPGQVEITQ